MDPYLCVGHLVQILVGHVNHEGVNPCKRGRGGEQEEDIITTTLHPLFPLVWPMGPEYIIGSNPMQSDASHSPTAFFYPLLTLEKQ